MEQTNDDQDKTTDMQNEQYANEQGYDRTLIEKWLEAQKFMIGIDPVYSAEKMREDAKRFKERDEHNATQKSIEQSYDQYVEPPDLQKIADTMIEEYIKQYPEIEAEKWAEKQLEMTELDEQLFTDMLLSNTATIHVDGEGDVTRIVPGSKEWWDVVELDAGKKPDTIGVGTTPGYDQNKELQQILGETDDTCYSSLEEILADIDDIKIYPDGKLHGHVYLKDKLENTIKAGKYIQDGTN